MCMGKSRDFGMYFTDSGACECEHDCKHVCTGCDKYFCEIKDECSLAHDEELPEYICTNAGNNYCHSDCLRDSR